MNLFAVAKKLATSPTLFAGAVALAGLALANHAAARRAERKHPPKGAFVEVDGVRLHYTDRGSGQPVVLVHGNAVAGDDYDTSGVAERLAETHRVIVFDRPGFGHSERPRGRLWTAMAQAELGRLLMPLLKRAMFSPAPVTARFRAEYSDAMALRPSQIRATSGDGTLMIPGAARLRHCYDDLRMPVAIVAGRGDKIVLKRAAERLHREIPGSVLRIVEGAGHMVHHSAPREVVDAIRAVAEASVAGGAPRRQEGSPLRPGLPEHALAA